MHTYSVDNDLRPRIVAFLGIASFLFVLGIGRLLSFLNTSIPFWPNLSAPATGAVFTVVYVVFATAVWNHWVFRLLRLVKTPYFAGEWEGYVRSSYNIAEPESGDPSDDEKTEVEVEIKQHWRQMIIRLEGEDSTSRSLGASIVTQQGLPKLMYYFLNEPNYDAPDSYSMGYGTSSMKLYEGEGDDGEDVLAGIYYTGPKRGEHGEIRLTRVDEEE